MVLYHDSNLLKFKVCGRTIQDETEPVGLQLRCACIHLQAVRKKSFHEHDRDIQQKVVTALSRTHAGRVGFRIYTGQIIWMFKQVQKHARFRMFKL